MISQTTQKLLDLVGKEIEDCDDLRLTGAVLLFKLEKKQFNLESSDERRILINELFKEIAQIACDEYWKADAHISNTLEAEKFEPWVRLVYLIEQFDRADNCCRPLVRSLIT